MFEYFKYQKSISSLKKLRLKTTTELDRFGAQAQSAEEYAEISYLSEREDKISTWIEFVQTEYQKSVCQKMLIPLPDHNDDKMFFTYNFDDNEGDRYIFTTYGFHHIRKLIRQEKKERLEVYSHWAGIIIGVGGMLIGLISVFKS
jgi:hypothetical protein